MLYYLPIEPIESRYTAQMLKWVVRELDEGEWDYQVIMPDEEEHSIAQGQFLDIYGTISWKARQIDKVSRLFNEGKVRPWDVFLIGDLWFPGIEAIPYMATLSGIPVTIWGWHYAGCADPNDFVQPCCNLGLYEAEKSWLKLADGVFVGSLYHKNIMYEAFGDTGLVFATGLVWDYEDVRLSVPLTPVDERPKRIIFPHRCAPEKNPEAFYRAAEFFADKGWDFIITSSRKGTPKDLGFKTSKYWRVLTGLSKQEYYDILSTCRVFFSSAYQETFGYALHEAVTFNVTPVCPKRLSYQEVLPSPYLYENDIGCIRKVEHYVEKPFPAPLSVTKNYHRSAKTALDIIKGYIP